MFKSQWEALHERFNAQQNCFEFTIEGKGEPVYVSPKTGSRSGEKAQLLAFHHGSALIRFDDGTTLKPAYGKVTLLDEDGRPDNTLRDMLGEPVDIGAFVAFSQSSGRSSHALYIGEIEGITDIGNLIVSAKLVNGRLISAYWSSQKITITPYRALKLPVDPGRMMLAVLTDFESVETGAYDVGVPS